MPAQGWEAASRHSALSMAGSQPCGFRANWVGEFSTFIIEAVLDLHAWLLFV